MESVIRRLIADGARRGEETGEERQLDQEKRKAAGEGADAFLFFIQLLHGLRAFLLIVGGAAANLLNLAVQRLHAQRTFALHDVKRQNDKTQKDSSR